MNLLNLYELVVCHQEEDYRCVYGEKAREPADGDGVWVSFHLLSNLS